MNKIDFEKVMNDRIAELIEQGKTNFLLHVCCAPCSSYVIEHLFQKLKLTLFFCNPNITERLEYDKRLNELKRFVFEAPFCKGIEVIDYGYNGDRFFQLSQGLEKEPEKGLRCTSCFTERLSISADYAKDNGFDGFLTTLTVSPHKNHELINRIGSTIANQKDIEYLPSDFKKCGGYQRSIELSRQYNLYRQNYCGCIFSKDNSTSEND